MKFLSFVMALLMMPLMAFASENIHVEGAYAFSAKSSMPATAGFMVVKNTGESDDKIIGFKTDAVGHVELHIMSHENEIMKMRRVDGYDVPAGGEAVLKPMGNHIMFFELKDDLQAGDEIKGTLVFEKAGEVPVTFHVQDRDHKQDHHGDHSAH